MSLLTTASEWREQGLDVAIATVIKTWGSAPRPAGSMLIVGEDGRFEGSVSGGCVEGAVIAEAKEVMRTGAPKKLSFGVADETAWAAGLACGGQIEVFVEAVE
jgi:xanthine/CO dehydrogenase XdhC/CoxF family maturation factor